MIIDEVARRMFVRNVADYADPALSELAWVDAEIRNFWIRQARAVLTDYAELATASRVRSADVAAPDPPHDPRQRDR